MVYKEKIGKKYHLIFDKGKLIDINRIALKVVAFIDKKNLLHLFEELEKENFIPITKPKDLLNHFIIPEYWDFKEVKHKIIWNKPKYLLGDFIKMFSLRFVSKKNKGTYELFQGHFQDTNGKNIDTKKLKQMVYSSKTNSNPQRKTLQDIITKIPKYKDTNYAKWLLQIKEERARDKSI